MIKNSKNELVIKLKGKEYAMKPCCGKPVIICEFDNYIQFKCHDLCRYLYVYNRDILEAYLFWNLIVENDIKFMTEVKNEKSYMKNPPGEESYE